MKKSRGRLRISIAQMMLQDDRILYESTTLHPSALETTIVSDCLSCPVGTWGMPGGSLKSGNFWMMRTIPQEASMSANSSVDTVRQSFSAKERLDHHTYCLDRSWALHEKA